MTEENYTNMRPDSYIDKLSLRKRSDMFNLFLKFFPAQTTTSLLDVGVTADRDFLASNYLEKLYPDKHKIIALSNQDAGFLEQVYPGLRFQLGDAKQLPFMEKSIDVVFSSAVIEHIGSEQNQKAMIAECVRVAKKGVFITTPNRWHPLEAHTLLPLLHWLPKKWHRALLKLLRFNFYALEENLNLLDQSTLTRICHELNIKHFSIEKIATFGFVSNLVLVIVNV